MDRAKSASAISEFYRSSYFAWGRPVWRFVKQTYHRSVNLVHGGAAVSLGSTEVFIPSEYSSLWAAREQFSEELALGRVADWCRKSPGGTFVDVGADIGSYSLLALALLNGGRIIAVDSSLASLFVAAQICRNAPRPDRLLLVHGFVTDQGQDRAFEVAQLETAASLRRLAESRRSIDPDYVVLGQEGGENIPCHTLDQLFAYMPLGVPTFLKIDIEGAEFKALAGARRVLSSYRPDLLLSIHPSFLRSFGRTREDVLGLLSSAGYRTELVCVDHEEHWWCQPESADDR